MMKIIKVKKVVEAKITGALLLASTVLAGIMPVPVFAQSKEAVCICEEKCTDESINEECEVCIYDHNFCEGEEAEPVEENYGSLTPDGNMNLVDDYGSLEAGGKQFITVTTKSGNYFYLIIDRDDKGTETVHFLNLVDEADLLALMEDEDAESYKDSQVTADADKEQEETTEETEETTEAPPEEKEEQEEKKGNNVTGIMAVVLIITLAGMGGFVYMKSHKGKKKDQGQDPDIDYFDDDEEDYLADMDIGEETVADQEADEDAAMEDDILMDDSDEE